MLFPDFTFPSVVDIPVSFFADNGIKGAAVDIDNTLTGENSNYISEEVRSWVKEIKASGVNLVIVSNNHEPRVKPFADDIGLAFICETGKPSPRRIAEILRMLDTEKEETVMVGDQIFTDVLFAGRCGIKSVLVEPMGPDDHSGAAIKRFFEHPIKWAVRLRRNI